jgi:hypothetical protein
MRRTAVSLAGVAVVLTVGGVFAGIRWPSAENSGDSEKPPLIRVYKSPACQCCANWEKHLSSAGFQVHSHEVSEVSAVRARYRVPEAVQSCHTAVIDSLVIEGHVPADVILDVLRRRPPIAGLAVPGMPIGSPGMEGERHEGYSVFSFTASGGIQEVARR